MYSKIVLPVLLPVVWLLTCGCHIAAEDRCPDGQRYLEESKLCECPGGQLYDYHQEKCACPKDDIQDANSGVCCPPSVAESAENNQCCPAGDVYDPALGVCCPESFAYSAELFQCCSSGYSYFPESVQCCPPNQVFDPFLYTCVPEDEFTGDSGTGWDETGFGAPCAVDQDCHEYGLNMCSAPPGMDAFCTWVGCEHEMCPTDWECCNCFGTVLCVEDDGGVCTECG